MNFRRGLFRNMLVSGGFNYVSQGIVFLSSMVVSRILTPEDYGLVGLLTVFTAFILVFADGGLSYAVIRSDYGRTYQKVLTNLSWILGGVLCLIVLLLAYPITLFYENDDLLFPIIVLSTIFVIKSLSLVQGAVLAKQLKFAYIGKVTLATTFVSVFLTIALAFLGGGHWSIIIPQIFSAVITGVLYEKKVKIGFRLYPIAYIIVVFKQTKDLVGRIIGFNVINYWARNADNLIVGKWYGASDLGIYSRAYSLMTLPLSLISGLMGSVLYPSLKKLKSEGGEINKEYMLVLKLITIICYPITFILVSFPNELVFLIWGEKWIKVGELLPYFGLLLYSQALLSTTGNMLVLQGKEKALMYSGWISAFFLIGGITIGAYYSLNAIAQYYSFCFIVFVLPFNLFYIFYYSLKISIRKLGYFWGPIILISIGLWYSCYSSNETLKFYLLITLFINIFINLKEEIKNLYSSISSRIKKYPILIRDK